MILIFDADLNEIVWKTLENNFSSIVICGKDPVQHYCGSQIATSA